MCNNKVLTCERMYPLYSSFLLPCSRSSPSIPSFPHLSRFYLRLGREQEALISAVVKQEKNETLTKLCNFLHTPCFARLRGCGMGLIHDKFKDVPFSSLSVRVSFLCLFLSGLSAPSSSLLKICVIHLRTNY